MKSTIQRALWAFTLKATVLRHPLPPAPMAATESEPEQPKVQRWEPVPDGPCEMVLGTIPAGTLKAGEPLSMDDIVDAYIAATAGEPGELGYMKEFQRLHLGEPYPYKGGLDLGAGDDKTVLVRYSNPSGAPRSPLLEKAFGKEAKEWVPVDLGQGGMHQGGWRIVGDGGPELEVAGIKVRECPALPPNMMVAALTPEQQQVMECLREISAGVIRSILQPYQHALVNAMAKMDEQRARDRVQAIWPRRTGKATALRTLARTEQRKIGRTTQQMLAAPKGAVFLWMWNDLLYPCNLAQHLGRLDLKIVGPSWLELDRWRGTRAPLVADHAAWGQLTLRHADMLRAALEYIDSRQLAGNRPTVAIVDEGEDGACD